MSIKVSQEVTSRLDEVRKGLNAESNAVVLRLSLIIGLKEKLFDQEKVDTNGFDIREQILFGEDATFFENYFKFVIGNEINTPEANEINRTAMHYGFLILEGELKTKKYDEIKFLKTILEDYVS